MLTLTEQSRQHRSDPAAFFAKAFEQFFGHHFTPDDALARWDAQLKNGMWYADDVLYAFRHVLEQGPEGLGERIAEATDGTFTLSSYLDGSAPFSDAEYHEWLDDMVATLSERFDNARQPSDEDAEELVFTDTRQEAIDEARDSVPFWATNLSVEVRDASEEYGEGAWSVHLSYHLPYR